MVRKKKVKKELRVILIIALIVAVVAIATYSVVSYISKDSEGPQSEEDETKVSASNPVSGAEGLYFRDEQSGISFNYPDHFSYYTIENEIGHSIVMEDDASTIGFQINVLPWDEGRNTLTVERVKRDLPNLVMNRAGTTTLSIRDGDLNVFTFLTPNDKFKELREVWFVNGGHLFQFVAPSVGTDDIIDLVFTTMSFR